MRPTMPRASRRRRPDDTAAPSIPSAWVLAGRAFVRGKLQPIEIAIGEDGRIASLGRNLRGAVRHDVGDAVILPAATDLHVHFRDPGPDPPAETVATGTQGAALGGVTLVGDMPNTEPGVSTVEILESKEQRFRGRAAVDVLLYANPSDAGALPELSRRAGGFKIYLAPSTGLSATVRFEALPALLDRLAGLRLPVAVHAEDPARFGPAERARDPVGWNAARPPSAESAALDALEHAPSALRLHIAHVTEPASADRLTERGTSFEASPHHLLLAARAGDGPRFKVNPPLRSEADRAALWTRFADGRVPMLASDHAPHLAASKETDFDRAPSGMPGVETMVPLLLAKVRDGDLSLPVLIAAACDRPARWLGQPLGRLAPGHRANLLVVDFRVRARLRGERLRSPSGWTAFEGWEAIFPREHYRDGEIVVQDGEYVGRPDGRVVRPEFAPAPGPS